MPQATHKEIRDNNQIIDSNHLPKKCVILTRDVTGWNLAIDFKYCLLLLSVRVMNFLTSLFVNSQWLKLTLESLPFNRLMVQMVELSNASGKM